MTQNFFVESSYLYLIAIILSLLEIQIEGQYQWAEKLPTWRKKFTIINKEITGYHIFLSLFVLLLFHLVYILGVEFSFKLEFKILSIIILLSVTEDFLWNVLNFKISFNIRNFKYIYKPFINKFFLYFPIEYYLAIFISFVLALLAQEIIWWIRNLIIFFIFTIILITFRYSIDR